jgi:demethylmenaquinone methyltransferase/2-methoxy-6-polyprenyl-1,4-benzoquinol methylase
MPDPADATRADYSAGRLDAGEVRTMFDRVAGVYDLLNTVMTAGLHHRWRARAADLARVGPGSRVLDVATGTGDLALELLGRVSPGGALAGAAMSFEWGDALDLPYPDDSFDAATVGFGARNFSDLGRGLAEMARVVRPGGRVVVLEMTTPTRPPLSWFYGVWFDRVVPWIGKLAALIARMRGASSQDTVARAYTYLPNSVKRFHSPPELAAEMERAGFVEIGYVLMAGGIIAVHGATVPG